MSLTNHCWAIGGTLALAIALSAGRAEAKDVDKCMEIWGRTVRSYLTQNRTSGPDDEVFKAACTKEDKDQSRVEAVLVGTRALAKLDPRGCLKFLEVYVEAKGPKKICDQATTSPDDVDGLRKLIAASLPPRKTK